ncbi:MAG: hypothetical protein ACRDCE_09460 [Cetobacterium sp.]|uniref:hypothetical protein n=1 Tax=Cetobacterium sp. TaxID=2071632 RepID=UPI003EE4CFF3
MSVFMIAHKKDLINGSLKICAAYRGDESAAEMVAHHEALIERLRGEIKDLEIAAKIAEFGAVELVSNGCSGKYVAYYAVAGGVDCRGMFDYDQQVCGRTTNRRAMEKMVKELNKKFAK